MFLFGYLVGTGSAFLAVAIIVVINKLYHRIKNK